MLAVSYNLQVVYLGVSTLGVATGVLGCFLLFRRRSLLSDTLGHATLPGVALAFLLVAQFGAGGKSFLWLLLGALVSGWLAVRSVQFLRRRTPIREDGALAVVLTVFYGVGVVWLSVIQNLELPGASGLEYYIYGMVASMVLSEALTLLIVSAVALVAVSLLFKELNALCFDEGFVAAQGLPHRWLDELLMLTCLVVTIAGLQTVGLLLIMAMFIIPPATARLWTSSMAGTIGIAAAVGAVGSVAGATASANIPRMPAGAAIILATAILFTLSLFLGRRKGLLQAWLASWRDERGLVERQLLRDVFALQPAKQRAASLAGAPTAGAPSSVSITAATRWRGWSDRRRQAAVGRLERAGQLERGEADAVRLTAQGQRRAVEAERTQALTELYLTEYPSLAPQHLHPYVERIEDVAPAEVAAHLRALFTAGLSAQAASS